MAGTDFAGRCHCGNVSYHYLSPVQPDKLELRACGCSFCCRHGARYFSHPQGQLRVQCRDQQDFGAYRFGTGTADFRLCSVCGVVVLASCEIDGRLYAVVNANTLVTPEAKSLACVPSDFEGENLGERLARRARNWIGDVHIEQCPGGPQVSP